MEYPPRLIVHEAGGPGADSKQYDNADDMLSGLKTALNGCSEVAEVQGGFVTTGKMKGMEYLQIVFKNGSILDFKEFINPEWGLAFFLHIKDLNEDNVTGMCKRGMDDYGMEPLGCPSLFSYYPDPHAKKFVYKGYHYHLSAAHMGPWTPEMAANTDHCDLYERPDEDWVPNPAPECPEDLKAKAQEHCKECDDADMRHDCEFDICIDGDVSAGDSVLNSCLNSPEIETYAPTKFPVFVDPAEVECKDFTDEDQCLSADDDNDCQWNEGMGEYPPCSDSGTNPCAVLGQKNKTCGGVAGCKYDKKSKYCVYKPPTPADGCAEYQKDGKSACKAVKGCSWSKNACSGTPDLTPDTGCAANDKKTPCKNVRGCIWKKGKCSGTVDDTPLEGCAVNTKKVPCKDMNGCNWKKGKCNGTPNDAEGCAALNGKTCKKTDDCSWTKSTNKCADAGPAPEVTPAPEKERSCTIVGQPVHTGMLVVTKARGNIQTAAEGMDNDDAACVCYETCMNGVDQQFSYYYFKPSDKPGQGKCFCYTSDYKRIAAEVGNGAIGGLTAELHASIDPAGA